MKKLMLLVLIVASCSQQIFSNPDQSRPSLIAAAVLTGIKVGGVTGLRDGVLSGLTLGVSNIWTHDDSRGFRHVMIDKELDKTVEGGDVSEHMLKLARNVGDVVDVAVVLGLTVLVPYLITKNLAK